MKVRVTASPHNPLCLLFFLRLVPFSSSEGRSVASEISPVGAAELSPELKRWVGCIWSQRSRRDGRRIRGNHGCRLRMFCRPAGDPSLHRHRGSGRPLSPATPPYMRVRIRRFDRLVPPIKRAGWVFAVWGRRGGFTSHVSIRRGLHPHPAHGGPPKRDG